MGNYYFSVLINILFRRDEHPKFRFENGKLKSKYLRPTYLRFGTRVNAMFRYLDLRKR